MSNVDSAELAKFAAQASRWWDPHGPFKTLHEINGLRTDYIAERAALSGARALDVGCGGGLLSEALADLVLKLAGIFEESNEALRARESKEPPFAKKQTQSR